MRLDLDNSRRPKESRGGVASSDSERHSDGGHRKKKKKKKEKKNKEKKKKNKEKKSERSRSKEEGTPENGTAEDKFKMIEDIPPRSVTNDLLESKNATPERKEETLERAKNGNGLTQNGTVANQPPPPQPTPKEDEAKAAAKAKELDDEYSLVDHVPEYKPDTKSPSHEKSKRYVGCYVTCYVMLCA